MGSKMNVKGTQDRITDLLAKALITHGFAKKHPNLIARLWGEAEAQVRCSARKDRTSERALATLNVGIRFEQVQALLSRAYSEPESPTISTPIHFLHADRQFQEWDAGDPKTPSELLSEIEEYAIPFFEKYCDFNQALFSLTSENPRDWFNLIPSMRISTLAAMLALRGKGKSALALLDKEIALRQSNPTPPMIAERLRFQRLRERISAL
jgi:hypothetical protein